MNLNGYGDDIINTVAAGRILDSLSARERDIIVMWASGSFTMAEIGRVVGKKYDGKEIKSSVIRYHRDKILKKLAARFGK